MHRFFLLADLVLGAVACNSGAIDFTTPDDGGAGGTGADFSTGGRSNVAGAGGTGDLSSCLPGAPLIGATYDVSKSRFAFGSTPIAQDAAGMTRWVGADGVVSIESCGRETGSMNAGAPAASLPDWSSDPAALSTHVRDYFLSLGIEPCQIASTTVMAGGSITCSTGPDASCVQGNPERTIALARGVDDIPVSESNAYARFNVNDQSISEGMYWPTVPADTVSAARALRDEFADPTALAAYQSKLPSNAQGTGQVVIHHSSCFGLSSAPFQSAATYDVAQSNPLGMGSMLSFDADGNPVTTSW